MLIVDNLEVKVDRKKILQGLSLKVNLGEVVAVMGPNGSGKSTLAYSLMGDSKYEVTGGKVKFEGEDLLRLSIDERARKGVFLGWQNPVTVKGVTVEQMLRVVKMNCRCEVCKKDKKCMNFSQFREYLEQKAFWLKMDNKYLRRGVNEGFSGGEKKKLEILQMMVLEPKLAVLDETDSGLDIDALRVVAKGINKCKQDNPKMGVLLITHYQRILKYIKPDRVLIVKAGRVIKEGDYNLVNKLEKEGYEGIK
jgi:Fe-S cluster assembly ATP-binding protein